MAVLGIALASLLFGAVVAVAGNPVGLLYSALFAVIMSLVAALGVAMRDQRRNLARALRTVSVNGSSATEILYSPRQFALLVALMTALAGTCVIGAVHLYLSQGMPVASALLAVFGLLGATFPVSALGGRIRRGALALSEHGVSQRGWSFESSLRWTDVAGVKAAYNGHPVILLIGYTNAQWTPRYTTLLWRIDRLPPVPMIEVDCRKFDVDCYALFDYLACYAENADLRSELGTSAAVTRAERMGTAP
ncbi:hypothetical protein [Mycobacterium sp. Root135]|uniref:hypothetical protein n=1 Tax=Mycobacterium sp. Root135 TaxID=1736457 RepID=UPI0012E99B8F|nr:hypothetical protein [Mycobacterium sp. Root135]